MSVSLGGGKQGSGNPCGNNPRSRHVPSMGDHPESQSFSLLCICGTHLLFCLVEGAGVNVLKVKQKSRAGPKVQLR